MNLIITNRLRLKKLIEFHSPLHLLSTRPLKTKELNVAKRLGIRRYYLPKLSKTESERFFIEFDRLWDSAIKPFDDYHPFWRNAISSKMQEWERSFTYLLLILYTLSKINNDSLTIVIVCSSLQEEDLCEEWGRKSGWKTIRNPSVRLPYQLCYGLQKLKLFLKFLYVLFLFLFQKFISPKYKKPKIKSSNPVLICSLIYSKSIKGGEFLDPFFGNLYQYYNRFGKTVINLCHPLDNFKKTVEQLSECKAANIVVPLSLIRWNEVISTVFRVFFRKILVNRVNFFDCDISKLIHWNARREMFFNLHAEFYYCAVKKLCRFQGFTLMIFPYEGNAFERACIQAFRKFNSSGTIIGYSHAVIYPLNLKIRLTEAEKSKRPTPDFFIATGPENKRLMVETGNHDEESIQTACALRNIPDLGKLCSTKSKNPTILIALDGVWSTAVVLNWFLENATILNEYDFIIRSHPNIPVGKLIEQCLYNIPENFSFSIGDLKTDFENCFCVIYRQTSVGLQALMNGIPAIHLNIDAPLPCDPIENLKAGKLVVSDTDQLLSAIKEIKSLSEESHLQAINEAKKYALEYFCERTDENINVFLKENG